MHKVITRLALALATAVCGIGLLGASSALADSTGGHTTQPPLATTTGPVTAAPLATVTPDTYVYLPIKNEGDGKCITSRGYGEGYPVELWGCDGTANQGWYVGSNGDIVNQGDGLCIAWTGLYGGFTLESCGGGNQSIEAFTPEPESGGYTAYFAPDIPDSPEGVITSSGQTNNGAYLEFVQQIGYYGVTNPNRLWTI